MPPSPDLSVAVRVGEPREEEASPEPGRTVADSGGDDPVRTRGEAVAPRLEGPPKDHGEIPGGAPDKTAGRVLSRLEMWGQKLGLERIRAVLEELEHPELAAPTVLVAGTNGKGSTSALIAAMGHAAGYRTGLYTSPHLESVEERIRVDGRAISSRELGARLEDVLSASPLLPTYFEALTAAAFLQFRQENVELAVLEVGLGGRLDATNVADPLISVITQLSLDHQEHLGHSLPEIAREKAGILRRARPALSWSGGDLEVGSALEEASRARQAVLEDSSRIVAVEVEGCDVVRARGGRWTFRVATASGRYELETALVGRHQGPNLALAVRAAEELSRKGFDRIDAAAIRAGAGRCRWPGRLERVILPDGRFVLLDAAHNPGGVDALLRYLRESETDHALDLLYGSLRDKGAEISLPRLARAVRAITLTRPPSDRALEPAVLAAAVTTARVEPDPETALASALDGVAPGGGLLVCGSIYLTGAVRGALHARFGVPVRAVDVPTS
ncbi:MAG TPA: Mur ligase family protein [Thermoanaerobaculia bacterium]|nr:Mur ligase family protein [Thermoanaerobaculia bacterium]